MTEVKLEISDDSVKSYFENAEVKERLERMLSANYRTLKEEYYKLKKFVVSTDNGVATLDACNAISYADVFEPFKMYFCKNILYEALELLFKTEGTYDLYTNILSVISKCENMFLKSMVKAFTDVIKDLPEEEKLDAVVKNGIVCRLEHQFL